VDLKRAMLSDIERIQMAADESGVPEEGEETKKAT